MKKLLFLFIIFISFSSCKKDSIENKYVEPSYTKSETVKQLNFIGQWLNEGKREILIREFAREYEFKNQHIFVNLKFPDEVYYDRSDPQSDAKFIEKNIKKDRADWDIIRINGDFSGTADYLNDKDWPSKYLVDFSKFPQFVRNINPQIDLEKVKKKWNGIVPGPILEGQYYALWVNNEVAKKIGIEVKQYGMTFSDFLSYVKAANDYNKNNGDKITILHDAMDWTTLASFAFQLYGSLVNEPDVFSNPSFSQPRYEAWKKTLYALEELSAYNILSPESRKISWNESKFDLLNEKCLFYSNGSWMFNIWDQENPEATKNCMPCEYPVFNTTNFYPGAFEVMWAVPKNSPNKQEAIDFLTAMNNPTMADNWVRYTKCPTGIRGNVVGVTFGNDLFENFSSEIQHKFGTNLYYVRESAGVLFGEEYASLNNLHIKDILLRDLTPDEVISELNEIASSVNNF